MEISKALTILVLHLKYYGKKMSPDTREAIETAISALEYVEETEAVLTGENPN